MSYQVKRNYSYFFYDRGMVWDFGVVYVLLLLVFAVVYLVFVEGSEVR